MNRCQEPTIHPHMAPFPGPPSLPLKRNKDAKDPSAPAPYMPCGAVRCCAVPCHAMRYHASRFKRKQKEAPTQKSPKPRLKQTDCKSPAYHLMQASNASPASSRHAPNKQGRHRQSFKIRPHPPLSSPILVVCHSLLSEGTPCPILRHAAHRLLRGMATRETALSQHLTIGGGSLACRSSSSSLLVLFPRRPGSVITGYVIITIIVVVVVMVEAILAPADAAGGIPLLIVAVAGVAGAGGEAVRVEVGVLVEGDGEGGVVRAEDVAAVAAVVPAFEDVEGGAALGRVAGGGLLVRLLMGRG
jgi:hypothetical protein